MQAQSTENQSVNDIPSLPLAFVPSTTTTTTTSGNPSQGTSTSMVSLESLNVMTTCTTSTTNSPINIPMAAPHDDSVFFSQLDDHDLLLLHDEFVNVVDLFAKVQKARREVMLKQNKAVTDTPNEQDSSYYSSPTKSSSSSLEPASEEAVSATMRVRRKLGPIPTDKKIVVTRGQYPITDSILDDLLEILKDELDRTEQQGQGVSGSVAATPPNVVSNPSLPRTAVPSEPENVASSRSTKSTKKKKKKSSGKEAIAVKYSKKQTDILMDWMIQHAEEPFPNASEIQELMRKTDLTQSQVVNWTTNVRKRNRKATLEGGKKPHHFIDFMFLRTNQKNQTVRRVKQLPSRQLRLPTRSSARKPGKLSSDLCSKAAADVPHSSHLSHLSAQQSLQPVGHHYRHHDRSPLPLPQLQLSSTTVTIEKSKDAPAYNDDNVKLMQEPIGDVVDDDLLEPLSLDDPLIDESLMEEFADFWLLDKGEERANEETVAALSNPVEDMFLASTKFDSNNYYNTSTRQTLLPSVTDDSHDEQQQQQSRGKRPHPVAMQLYEELEHEDIHSWAAELGLTIEL